MSNLEKYHTINRTDLNDEFFFQSILEEAFKHNLLADTEVENLQNQCLELLALKVEQYNRGYSSSVRVEVAENIMKSNLYTLSLYLKSMPNTSEMITELKTVSISDIYIKGRRLISAKLHSAKHLLILARRKRITTKNIFYNSTINEGINQFLVGYNPDFEAHEIPVVIDYQLCNPVGHFAGIEFIQKYIEGFFYENEFCKLFPTEKIHFLLSGYDDRYDDLLINICDHVLTTSLGCIMIDSPAADLNITPERTRELTKRFSAKNKNELNTVMQKAYALLEKQFCLKNRHLQQYLRIFLPSVISNVYNAVNNDALNKVFVTCKYNETAIRSYFSFGRKMDDKEYRKVIDEILQCRYSTDKILIIKENIHSLSDLEDLLHDAQLTQKEILKVLSSLDISEIVALAERNLYSSSFDDNYLTESEIIFRRCLDSYIRMQTPAYREQIIQIAKSLQDK